MNVGIPGAAREPAAPRRHGAGHVAKWLLAALGAALAYLAAQVAALVAIELALPAWDADGLVVLATAASLALAALWWRRLRPEARLRREVACPSRPERRVLLAGVLLVLGIALQVTLSIVLTMVLPLFPDVMEFYLELMELAGVSGQLDLVTFVDLAVLAPAAEELICRGVILEFCLRATCPEVAAVGRLEGEKGEVARAAVPTARFWAANVAQALVFALMHLNIVQGAYAFALGLLLGWLVRRTGRLRYAALLHMAVNGASVLMDVLDPLLGDVLVPTLVVGGVVTVALVWAVARLTAEPPADADADTDTDTDTL